VDGQRRDWFIEQVLKCRTASGRAELGQALSALCVRALPDVDGAALVFYSDSRAQGLAGASDPWAAGIEEAQYTLGEGPGFAAVATRGPVLVPDLSLDEVRWPVFAGTARGEGLAAAFLFPLQVGAILLGTLGLYRRRPGALSTEFVSEATLLADLIAHRLLLRNQRPGCWPFCCGSVWSTRSCGCGRTPSPAAGRCWTWPKTWWPGAFRSIS
jgi:hypothetical protein